MASAFQDTLIREELETFLQLSEAELQSENFAGVYSDIQALVWRKVCQGEVQSSLALRERLRPYGRDLFMHKTVRNTLLHEAVLKASADVVGQLLAVVTANARNSAGQTALMLLLSHNPPDIAAKLPLLLSAPLACDMSLRTTCHYVLRSSLSAVSSTQSSKLQVMNDLRAQNSADQFRLSLLTIDSESHTVFSLAGLAFPGLENYKQWLDFLSEVFAVPVQEVVQYPHFLLVQGTTHQMNYSDELFQQVCGAVQSPGLNRMMKNRYKDWGKYSQSLPQGFPVSVVEMLVKTRNDSTLEYVLELGGDCNYLSGMEPLWLILAKVPISENLWKFVNAPSLYYFKKATEVVHSYEYQENSLNWLTRLHSSVHSIAPALRYCLEALKTRVPDYTKTYLEALWQQDNNRPLYSLFETHLESIL